MKKNINKLLKGNKSGLTLIEALAVIALGALVITGMILAFGDGQDSIKQNEAITEIADITKELQKTFANESSTGLDNSVAISAGMLPTSTRNNSNEATGVIKSKLDGEYVIAGSSTDGNDFSLTANGLDTTEKCLTAYQAGRSIGYDRIDINGTENNTPDWTLTTATTACNGASPATVILYND